VVGVSVEVGACALVPHGRAGLGVPGGDLGVAQVDAGVEHGRHVSVAQHVRVHLVGDDPGLRGEVAEPPGGSVTVHPQSLAVEQDRPGLTLVTPARLRLRSRSELPVARKGCDGTGASPSARVQRWTARRGRE